MVTLVSEPATSGSRANRGFTIEHPFATAFLVTLAFGILGFAVMFPPLIYLPEKTLASFAYEWAPLIRGVLCMVIIVRSGLWKLLRLK
jgi:hypothetical protein